MTPSQVTLTINTIRKRCFQVNMKNLKGQWNFRIPLQTRSRFTLLKNTMKTFLKTLNCPAPVKEFIHQNTRISFRTTRKLIDLTRMDREKVESVTAKELCESKLENPLPCLCHLRPLTSSNCLGHTFVRTDKPTHLKNLLDEHPALNEFKPLLTSSFLDRVKLNTRKTHQDTKNQISHFLRNLPGVKGKGKAFAKAIWNILDLDEENTCTSPEYRLKKTPHTKETCSKLKTTLSDLMLMLIPLEKKPHHALILCPNIFFHVLHLIFSKNKTHFSFVKECVDSSEAKKFLLNAIKKATDRLKLPLNRSWKEARAPSAIPLIKAKTLLTELDILWKVRPLISQFKHPLTKNLKLAARCLRILQKTWRNHHSYKGFELQRMTDITEFIDLARNTFPFSDVDKPDIRIEERDIDDMFNNVPMKKARNYLKKLICTVKRIVTSSPRLQIYIHIASNPNDDHISTSPSSTGCITLTTDEFMSIMKFDMNDNKRFRIGNCIILQKMGTAQGGYISSELSCLYVETREHLCIENEPLLRTPLFKRFRDNILIIAKKDDPIWNRTPEKLKNLYCLPLKLEHAIETPTSI